jgi:hypothetical protein
MGGGRNRERERAIESKREERRERQGERKRERRKGSMRERDRAGGRGTVISAGQVVTCIKIKELDKLGIIRLPC